MSPLKASVPFWPADSLAVKVRGTAPPVVPCNAEGTVAGGGIASAVELAILNVSNPLLPFQVLIPTSATRMRASRPGQY
ncbi:MAG: hypothetical protein NT167_17545, partial [Verrucomicrobia bacterium]|nr:hypothetical protein [Verrucomicrobiota bacterium]